MVLWSAEVSDWIDFWQSPPGALACPCRLCGIGLMKPCVGSSSQNLKRSPLLSYAMLVTSVSTTFRDVLSQDSFTGSSDPAIVASHNRRAAATEVGTRIGSLTPNMSADLRRTSCG